MKYHPELGPPPTVGVEIEVARWARGVNMLNVAENLEDAGYMPTATFSAGRHDYHCPCNVCTELGSRIYYPPMFKMQRDASLPPEGAEFISSPFPVSEPFMVQAMDAYRIIGQDARRPDRNTFTEREERLSEVGLHVHVYSDGPDFAGLRPEGGQNVWQLENPYDPDNEDLAALAISVYQEFAPELFRLAATANCPSRSLFYRMPNKKIWSLIGLEYNPSHMFLVVTNGRRNDTTPTRLEWRLWEIPYDDAEYVQGAIIVSSALTQVLHRTEIVSKMGHLAALLSYDRKAATDLDGLLDQFDQRRFNLLKEVVLYGSALAEDKDMAEIAERLFNRV